MRRVPRSPIDQAHSYQAERTRRLPAKWLAATLITAAVGLLAPGVSYVTAGRSGATTATRTAAKTWRVVIYSPRHPGGLTVASRTFTLKRGWYWWGFGVHQAYRGLAAVCVTASESFGVSCVHFTTASAR